MPLPPLATPALASPDSLSGTLFLLALLSALSGAVMAVCSRSPVAALAGLSLCGLGQSALFCFLGAPLLAAIQGMALFAGLLALLHPGIRKKPGIQDGVQSGRTKALSNTLVSSLGLVVALLFALALVLPFAAPPNGAAPWLAHDLQARFPARLPAKISGLEAFLLPGVLLLFSVLAGIVGHFALGLPRPVQAPEQAPKTDGDAAPEP